MGRKAKLKNGRMCSVFLEEKDVTFALYLGSGIFADGVRRALRLAESALAAEKRRKKERVKT